MRYVLAFSIVILGCSCSLAQQPKEYTLVLTQEELTLVGTALAEMPLPISFLILRRKIYGSVAPRL